MRNTWDINELRRNREILINKNESNKEINSTINAYNFLINGNRKKYNFLNLEYTNPTIHTIVMETCNFENDDTTDILNLLLKSSKTFNSFQKDPMYYIPLCIDNSTEFIENTLAFFKVMTNKDMYDAAEKILNPNNHILNIVHTKKDNNCHGITFYDQINEKKYIGIERENCLNDYHVIVHEIFHHLFMTKYIGDNKKIIFNRSTLTEVEGLLANILFAKFHQDLASKINPSIKELFKNMNIDEYKEKITALTLKNTIMCSLSTYYEKEKKKNNNPDINKFFNELNLTFKFKKYSLEFKDLDELIKHINTNQITLTQYSLGFLIALDLYYIYLIDPEYAFYLLKNIKGDLTEDPVLKILYRNDITFMEDNYSNLKKYIKK